MDEFVEVRRTSSRLSGKKRPYYGDDNIANHQSEEGTVVEVEGDTPHQRVKAALRIYNIHYLECCREKQLKKGENGTGKGGIKRKKENQKKGEEEESLMRPVLIAWNRMKKNNQVLNRNKMSGDIPGINVGHHFYSRAEMCTVGLHGEHMKGIGTMKESIYGKLEKYKDYNFPIAVSVVLSGVYEDNSDNLDDVEYTGEGGNDVKGGKRQRGHQLLTGGNLALWNSMGQKVPVRLIRGYEFKKSYSGKVYTYDGLYDVKLCKEEKGISGFTIYKFQLKRKEGQPPLTSSPVHHVGERISQSLLVSGKVCNDISYGAERFPIPAYNTVDNPPLEPASFTYTKSVIHEGVEYPKPPNGCRCEGPCSDNIKCDCAKLNGGELPYVDKDDGGLLIQGKDVVFECGPNCTCSSGCVNKTSQGGLRFHLEVFRTPHKGWGLRSSEFIPSGAPVCEYTGKLMRTEDLDTLDGNNYIFDIDCLETKKGLDGRTSRQGVVALCSSTPMDDSDDRNAYPEFGIDARDTGGVARFINHSCDPNLFVQCVLSSHHDVKFARVMLFAGENILPLQELTYDYGYKLGSVCPDGKTRELTCYCGASNCKKRLY